MSIDQPERRIPGRRVPMVTGSVATAGDDPGPVEPQLQPAGSGAGRRVNPRQFLHEVNVELRKVAWPTRAETINYATVVFIALAALMALIFGLDVGFSKIASFLFK